MGSIYKRNESKFYWMRYRDAHGKLVRRSTDTADLAEAKAALAEQQLRTQLERLAIADLEPNPALTPYPLVGMGPRLDARVHRLERAMRRLEGYLAFEADLLRLLTRASERLVRPDKRPP
jgi:hypothetical protein